MAKGFSVLIKRILIVLMVCVFTLFASCDIGAIVDKFVPPDTFIERPLEPETPTEPESPTAPETPTEPESPTEPETPTPPPVIAPVGEFSIHFMTLGNYKAGDCIYIKAGETDILIDAGSDYDSIDDICDYLDGYVLDDTLEYVIVTHADMDHIASFAGERSIFSEYVCQTIIDFPLSNKTTKVYEKYKANRDAEVESGANHFTALECYNESKEGAKRIYQLADSITMEILNNYYYSNKSSDENNYSVCVNFKHGNRNFLFTGDLEKEGEEYLVALNDLPEVEFYKAGHHGSKTSSTDLLLNEIKPKLCVVSCVAGTDEYTDILANQFPTQDFINRISKWTEKVYVPVVDDTESDDRSIFEMLNGDIIINSTQNGVEVIGSENNTLLKDTEWFKGFRDCPAEWQIQPVA